MSSKPWWSVITAQEIIDLRKRLLRFLTEAFGREMHAETEDLVQQAFLALMRNKDRVLPDGDGLFRYLRRVAKNAALDRAKSAAVRLTVPGGEGVADIAAERQALISQASILTQLEQKEEFRRIRKIFCKLDDLDRLVLWSFVVDGKSINAIAGQLDLKWRQVHLLIGESMAQIRQQLS